jgi:hypothetical protein
MYIYNDNDDNDDYDKDEVKLTYDKLNKSTAVLYVLSMNRRLSKTTQLINVTIR